MSSTNYSIEVLKDKQGSKIAPVTVTNAIYDTDGVRLDEKISKNVYSETYAGQSAPLKQEILKNSKGEAISPVGSATTIFDTNGDSLQATVEKVKNLIIDAGESNPEVVAARTDISGVTHETLGQRLSNMEIHNHTSLNDIMNLNFKTSSNSSPSISSTTNSSSTQINFNLKDTVDYKNKFNFNVTNSTFTKPVLTIGLKDLSGDSDGELTVNGEIYCRKGDKGIGIGVGKLNDDVFIYNQKGDHFLNLSDSGNIQYAGQYLVRENSATHSDILVGDNKAIKTLRTVNGVTDKYTIYAKSGNSNGLDFGDSRVGLTLHSSAAPAWWDGQDAHIVSTSYQARFKRSGGDYTIRTTNSTSLLFANNNNNKHFAISNTANTCDFYTNCDGGYTFDKNANFVYAITIDGHDVPHSNKNFVPIKDGYHWVGIDGQAFWGMRVTGGGFGQTSDVRAKEDIRDVNDEIFFDMVKNTPVHTYIYKDADKDELSTCDLKEERTQETVDSNLLNLGIIAQEMAEFEGSDYILNQSKDGIYTVNLYNFSAAIMSALKHEISKREELEDYVKSLKKRLELLEK